MEDPVFAKYVERLQNVPPFNVPSIDPDGTTTKPWYSVTGALVNDLVITDTTVVQRAQVNPAQIYHWGRHVATTKRCWEIVERQYRQWRDGLQIEYSTPPPGVKTTKANKTDTDEIWKKPSEETIAAMIRTHKDYAKHQIELEKAEEAYNSAVTALDAFRAQRDVLKAWVARAHDQTNPELRG